MNSCRSVTRWVWAAVSLGVFFGCSSDTGDASLEEASDALQRGPAASRSRVNADDDRWDRDRRHRRDRDHRERRPRHGKPPSGPGDVGSGGASNSDPSGFAGANMGSGGMVGAAGAGGGFPFPNTDVCGDEIWGFFEQCDDGNTSAGDGCSEACEVESGFVCSEPGQACRIPECGDGLQDVVFVPGEPGVGGSPAMGNGGAAGGFSMGSGGAGMSGSYTFEQCDDGNTDSGDGCDDTCNVEAGFNCDDGSCHAVVCGDAVQESYALSDGSFGYESCDDGNAASGDGCSSSCEVEPGFVCPSPGQACREPSCGDGFQDGIFVPGDPGAAGGAGGMGPMMGAGGNGGSSGYYLFEQCDDGNDTAGDGCNSSCEIEPGYICGEPGTPCRVPVCGDGFQDYFLVGSPGGAAGAPAAGDPTMGAGGAGGYYVAEQCDDGNDVSDDGCSSACEIEPDYVCPVPGAACRIPVCGDGFVDLIFVPGESGSAGAFNMGSAGAPTMGSGGGSGDSGGYYTYEQCDDANQTSGDGCSATCEVE